MKFPLTYGHVLVIPKKKIDYIFDIDSDEYSGLWNFAKKAKAMDKVLFVKGLGSLLLDWRFLMYIFI